MVSNYTIPYNAPHTTRVNIKICGVTRPEHALFAAQCGADMVGIVFTPSRRQVSIEVARAIRRALDSVPVRPMLVGVFVNQSPVEVWHTARSAGLDMVQLSGDEPLDSVLQCLQYLPVVKALRFQAGTMPEDALAMLDAYAPYHLSGRIRFLVDAHHPVEYGGTGTVADWSLAAAIAGEYPIMLAGGLNPHNVGEAIAQVSPWGIDVSSGVERDGVKDPGLIREFIDAARLYTP